MNAVLASLEATAKEEMTSKDFEGAIESDQKKVEQHYYQTEKLICNSEILSKLWCTYFSTTIENSKLTSKEIINIFFGSSIMSRRYLCFNQSQIGFSKELVIVLM